MSVFDSAKKIISGDAAHDAADAGSPVKIGGKALLQIPSVVSADDRVNAYFDLYGRQVTHIQTMSHEPPNEFMGRWTSAPVAAEAYGWGFENPADSGKTCIIDQMWLASVETSVITLVMSNVGSYTATQNVPQATNIRTFGGSTVVKLLSAFTPSGLSCVCTFPFYAGEKLFLPFNGAWRLFPGEAIAVYKEAGSTTGVIYWNIMWRELP